MFTKQLIKTLVSRFVHAIHQRRYDSLALLERDLRVEITRWLAAIQFVINTGDCRPHRSPTRPTPVR